MPELAPTIEPERVELCTVADAASAFRVSPDTVRNWCATGRLRSTKLGPRRNSPLRIPSTEIARLLREGLR